jgi:hypothetical protein
MIGTCGNSTNVIINIISTKNGLNKGAACFLLGVTLCTSILERDKIMLKAIPLLPLLEQSVLEATLSH